MQHILLLSGLSMASAREFRYRDYYYDPEVAAEDFSKVASATGYSLKAINTLRSYYPSLDTSTFNKRVENHVFGDVGGGTLSGAMLGAALGSTMAGTEMGAELGSAGGPVGTLLGAGAGSIVGVLYYATHEPLGKKAQNLGGALMIGSTKYPKGSIFGVKGVPKDGKTTFFKFLGFDDGGQSDGFTWIEIGKTGAEPKEMGIGALQILLDGKGLTVPKLHHGHLDECNPQDQTVQAEEEYEDMLQAQYRRNQGRAQYRNEGRTMRRRDSRKMQRMSRLYN